MSAALYLAPGWERGRNRSFHQPVLGTYVLQPWPPPCRDAGQVTRVGDDSGRGGDIGTAEVWVQRPRSSPGCWW